MADKKLHGTEYDKRGENNPNRKLTEEQVAYVRRVNRKGRGPYDTGNTLALSEELGVTPAMIRRIARGDNW